MEASNKPLRSPAEELFDLASKLVAVWGTAFMVVDGVDHLLREVLPRAWHISISLAAAYLFLLAFFWGGEKRPALRDGFLAWRYPIAMLLAAYVGYLWHAHDYGRSREGRLNEAARWACARNVSCQKLALGYSADKEFDD